MLAGQETTDRLSRTLDGGTFAEQLDQRIHRRLPTNMTQKRLLVKLLVKASPLRNPWN
jgi:hypothetical protein